MAGYEVECDAQRVRRVLEHKLVFAALKQALQGLQKRGGNQMMVAKAASNWYLQNGLGAGLDAGEARQEEERARETDSKGFSSIPERR